MHVHGYYGILFTAGSGKRRHTPQIFLDASFTMTHHF